MLRSLSYTSGEQGRAYAQASAEALTLARICLGLWDRGSTSKRNPSWVTAPESGQPCQLLVTV